MAIKNRLAPLGNNPINTALPCSWLSQQSKSNLSDQVSFPQNWIKLSKHCLKYLWRTRIYDYSLLIITGKKQQLKPLTYSIKKAVKSLWELQSNIIINWGNVVLWKYMYFLYQIFGSIFLIKVPLILLHSNLLKVIFIKCSQNVLLWLKKTQFHFIITRNRAVHLFPYQYQYLFCEVPFLSINLCPTNFAWGNQEKLE